MSRFYSKIMMLVAGGLVCLLLLLELSAYVMTVTSVPSRVRARIGKGNIPFQVEQRKKILAARSKAVFAAAAATPGQHTDEYSGPAMFHGVLGWDYPANVFFRGTDGMLYAHGPDGERRTCTAFPDTAIATYGDSFTHCDEVSDELTWQTFLGEKIGSNVLNYGVGGYGTDQVFLKFLLHRKQRAQVVMLCILPENINRVVNIYRPFYNYDDPLALTKPRFVRKSSGFEMMPNPIDHVALLHKLEDPSFLTTLGRSDYWFQHDRSLQRLAFPFTLSALSWRREIADHVSRMLSLISPSLCEPRFQQNLFDESEPFAIMCHITDLFVQTAKERGLTPVIAIMPHKDYVREALEFHCSRVSRLTAYLTQKQYPHVDLIQAMADLKPSTAQLDAWYKGHATAEGNRVTADLLYRYVQRQGLLASHPATP